MTALYQTGNISGISPFIRTENVHPELLDQGRINGIQCGLPVLVFNTESGYRTYFVFANNYNYGLKGLDCLDLQILMTDSVFLSDVCRACNAKDEVPHVYPPDPAVYERLSGK